MTTPPYPQHPEQSGPPQPGYPQQGPYGPPAPAPYGRPAPYGKPGASGRGGLGLTAAILGAIPLVVGIVQALATTALAQAAGYAVVGVFSAVFNGLSFVFGVAAVVVGAIALSRKTGPKALAGIGVGLGISAVVGGVTAGIYTLLASLPY